ncbi:quinohemoprotein amine dehydrogenase subunit alpha [Neptunomonas marina]|uniref:Quinohemoprotein amine dehydrogenase subunit alpha n=1 Tax=Neptunomonas marina TaxID=1815562 RepID=A0A437Q574_9GAMM|nr:quinohemoprotein amine dehydrogenase subunit alpha [Neptunomonas marina]RVU29645.1 quinohemoprotein amine dehydrogenase subunit alpha [Neptunomonas marina]
MNNNKSKRALLGGSALALLGAIAAPTTVSAMDGASVLQEKCLICHTRTGDPEAPYSRISQQRKTPEGWHMTINRMQRLNGLVISPQEKQAVIQYLADTQGLAPSETAPYRYVLEQQPNVVEQDIDPAYVEMCARCHSSARFGLQRRTEAEWKLHVNTHMAINPTTELHALARDRSWYDIALNDTAPKLAKDFNFHDAAWKKWQAAPKPELAGRWSVAGFLPEQGDYSATLTITPTSNNRFELTLDGHFVDGTALKGSGKAKLYAGYEWRAQLNVNGTKMRQVMAASEDGQQLTGRMYQVGRDEMGGEINAHVGTAIAGVSPAAIKQGAVQEITIMGSELKGNVSLGRGVSVEKVLTRDNDRIVVLARAQKNATVGARDVRVGQSRDQQALAVYDQVARVAVVPAESIARVGGNGGLVPKVQSTYRAQAFSAGPDGKAGTADDLNLGYMPANWSVAPFNETAEHDKDTKYAGSIDQQGIFTPGDAGLNPERKFSTNNLGNLKVVASMGEGDEQVSGDAHLLVTVPVYIKRAVQ